jgi:hypothetical protein
MCQDCRDRIGQSNAKIKKLDLEIALMKAQMDYHAGLYHLAKDDKDFLAYQEIHRNRCQAEETLERERRYLELLEWDIYDCPDYLLLRSY